MGLVPSRESLYGTPTDASKPCSLPFISRAAENYMYKTNRTERVFQSGMVLGSDRGGPIPTALLNGLPATELSRKIMEADSNAVFIEDPAEATAAVAASRGSRRGSSKSTEAQSRGGDAGTLALETPAAEALRQGKVPYVYYYEHQVLPLTTEFFPSPDCVLFRQLWHARKHQNPRYHFQLDHTWSPGALTDPTAAYESFAEVARRNMVDIQAACLSTGHPVTEENVAQARDQLQAAIRALNGSEAGMGHSSASFTGSQRTRVPFATREEFYNLVVLTTKEAMLCESNAELRNIVCAAAVSTEAMRKHTGNADSGIASEEGSTDERDRQRLRPVPCAIVLVRRCMPAHEYRYTYFVANNERHHKASVGAAGSSSRRRGSANACRTGEAHQTQQREPHSTLVCGDSVRAAVKESHLVNHTADGELSDYTLTVPWLQVSAPEAPLGLAELRVVGMYGCWTIEEILRHTLFAPTVQVPPDCHGAVNTAATQNSPAREAHMKKVLRRAAPHGVPSSTLVNTAFFEKQVGDKEQCHTYFALCRLFAHGMRRCILGDTSDKAAGTSTGVHAVCENTSTDDEAPEEPSQETGVALTERLRANPAWQAFLDTLTGAPSAMSLCGDLANCFLIRFSNIPQLQLCRQIRRMLMELRDLYPAAPSLEGFQAAQRQRNMAAMSKKSSANDAGTGAAHGGDPSAHGSTPPKCCNGGKDTTVPPSPHGECEDSLIDNTGALPSALAKTHGKQQPEGATIARGCSKSAALPLSLDPEAIAQRAHHLCEKDRLERDGFCCYASHGLVVFRLSRIAVAHALNQLSFAPLHDSVEALCVTLTAAAPPPLTYRGELRPPARLRTHTMEAAAADMGGVGDEVEGGDEKEREGALPGVEAHSPEVIANMYNNAVRYSSCATGFPMEPLWPIKLDSVSWTTHATTLEDTPDELIGVLPRNSIEQRRGRLLPLRGTVMSEGTATAGNSACSGGAAHQGSSFGTSVPSQLHQQRHNQSSSSSTLSSALFQVDVYTVSAELDGVPFRELVELMHQQQQQQQRRQSTSYDPSSQSTLRLMIESVDAQGNLEPDSVLNWSPMTALGSLRWKRALSAAERRHSGVSGDRRDVDGVESGMRSIPILSQNVTGSKGFVSIFVHEPERILHTGDRIRFAPHRGGSPNSGERNSPMDTPGSRTNHTRSRSGGNTTSGTSQYGYWYVDDNLTTEDMILSWMRRVGGRARETFGTDTKWVRFPEPVLQVLLRFAHACRQQPGGGWLITGHALHPLHPSDEELVEPDLLQSYPDILRTRRFRQWRFSHDGYVYFHGVTVRIPGSAPLPSHPPPAAVMATSAYHAMIHNRGDMAFGLPSRRSSGLTTVSNARATFEPTQQRSVGQRYAPAMQFGYNPPPSDAMPPRDSGESVGDQYTAHTVTGGSLYHANQAMGTVLGGNAGVSSSAQGKHCDPSMASQQLNPYLSAVPPHQALSQHVPRQYPRQQLPPNRQYSDVASLHHTIPKSQALLQASQEQQRGPEYGPATFYGSAGLDPRYISADHVYVTDASEPETTLTSYYGDCHSSASEGMGIARPATPNAMDDLYVKDADPPQSRHAATSRSSTQEQECRQRGYYNYPGDGVSFSEGMPSGGAAAFVEYPDGTFYPTSDAAYPAADMMVPGQATGNYYGGICCSSVEQGPHTPQQQQYSTQAHLPCDACELASSHERGSQKSDSTLLSYGLPPHMPGIVPPSEEVSNPLTAADGCGREHEEATGTDSESSVVHGSSDHQQYQQHLRQQPQPSMPPPPSAPSLPPLQQPVHLSLHAEGDRVGHASERRTTDDYPRRRSSTGILTTTSMSVSAAKPTSQKLLIQTLRCTHPNAGHRAPPVASFAPDVIDPSPLSPSGGHARPAMMPKERTAESVDRVTEIGMDDSTSSRLTPARALPAGHPDFSSTTQPVRPAAQTLPQQHQQPPQQPLQQAHVRPLRSPQLASGPGSFRETITADVIEAHSITVRVMQRKSSTARQLAYNGAIAGGAPLGYRAGSGACGNSSNAVGDGGAQDSISTLPMGYGAMGVSPSGGLEGVREEVNSVHRKTVVASMNSSQAAPEHWSYGISQMRTLTTGQQVASGRSTSAVCSASQLQRQSSMRGPSSPTQRTSQRISHNPYTTVGSLSVTPLTTAAGLSMHSQGGFGGGRAGSNGPQDSFADALDNRYGSASDFSASTSASPVSPAHNLTGPTHGTCSFRCACDSVGFRGSPATSQRRIFYPTQRATGDAGDFPRADQQQYRQHGSYGSFYEVGEDAPTSTQYSDMYQNAAADGTTQGFFFSMGEYEETRNCTEGLYGDNPHYQYNSSHNHALQLEGKPVKGAGREGSGYGNLGLPTRNMHHHHYHHQPPPCNMSGGNACTNGPYEDSTPASALPYSPQSP